MKMTQTDKNIEDILELIELLQVQVLANSMGNCARDYDTEVTKEIAKRIDEIRARNVRVIAEVEPLNLIPTKPNEIVHCKDCKYLMFSDCYGECSKAYKGIVNPNDSCGYGVKRYDNG